METVDRVSILCFCKSFAQGRRSGKRKAQIPLKTMKSIPTPRRCNDGKGCSRPWPCRGHSNSAWVCMVLCLEWQHMAALIQLTILTWTYQRTLTKIDHVRPQRQACRQESGRSHSCKFQCHIPFHFWSQSSHLPRSDIVL